jgi:hypothetical protein
MRVDSSAIAAASATAARRTWPIESPGSVVVSSTTKISPSDHDLSRCRSEPG